MPESTVVPKCSCGHGSFTAVSQIEFNMVWVCCAKCGAVIAYRDLILLDKLDKLDQFFEATKFKV